MNHRRRKHIITIAILASIVAAFIFYFQLLSFILVNIQNNISITHSVFGIENGKSFINTQVYNDITPTQKAEIVSLFEQYKYHRKWNTFTSDGSLSGVGSDLIFLHLYDENEYLDSISISNNGKIRTADRAYKMKNAQELVNRLLEILNPAK